MLQDYSNLSVHVQDSGLFVELARVLSRHFSRVTYWCPWHRAFPRSSEVEIGDGIPGIKRVADISEVINETDLFIFPDIYAGPTQLYLQDLGKRVWGSRDGDELERFRSEAKNHFKELGISQGSYEVIRGVQKLRKYLQKREGETLWVKINNTRGDMETMRVQGYELQKNQIDDLEYRLGPRSEYMEFIVEDDLTDSLDIAIDTFSIDGAYPKTALLGTEVKEQVYIGARHTWDEMPANLRATYDQLSKTLSNYNYRNFLSLESRARKHEAYLCDPCCRFGSPPSELQMEMIQNLPDIFWFGADGQLVEPEIPSKFGIEMLIYSDWSSEHPLRLDFPEELRDKLKFHFATEFDGKTWIMPQKEGPRFGVIVEHGNNLNRLIEQIQEDIERLKGAQIETYGEAFPKALENIKQMKGWNINF
jgi:hypothetical protein